MLIISQLYLTGANGGKSTNVYASSAMALSSDHAHLAGHFALVKSQMRFAELICNLHFHSALSLGKCANANAASKKQVHLAFPRCIKHLANAQT
jgi:hypothetical protein